jgi:hypothetical protein
MIPRWITVHVADLVCNNLSSSSTTEGGGWCEAIKKFVCLTKDVGMNCRPGELAALECYYLPAGDGYISWLAEFVTPSSKWVLMSC